MPHFAAIKEKDLGMKEIKKEEARRNQIWQVT